MDKDSQPLLFRTFPGLAGRVPFVPLLPGPTPVERLEAVSQALGREIWVKRDDLTSPVYGGNKPRKLQFLLAEAAARGARAVATMGGIGTNHGLATAVFGSDQGFPVRLILFPQPVTDSVRDHLKLFKALGARLTLCPDWQEAEQRIAAVERDEPEVYAIPAGGSNPVGALGYVEAGLELADQVKRGLLPRPEAVYLATGTGGTAAGMALGLKLAGLASPVRAVGVVPPEAANTGSVLDLAARTLALLRRRDPSIPDLAITPADLEVDQGFLGEGYGHPTPEGRAAMELMAREAITLDQTYTGKAFAGLAAAAAGPGRGPLLFVNSYSSADLGRRARDVDWRNLPPEFHRFFV